MAVRPVGPCPGVPADPATLRGHDSIDVRVSVAVMTASMAYMLAAMIS
ncbi:hypothetical protein IU500_34750 [Nocardia terpenica]|nr:hypothetical protein [Nocardia terpenica]MBF6066133.1 hypothetical protein [Nocardia terpenica]MBF6109176.1 hypothetical protein [Nocardia terpenica]MBF6116377.1 hypothetical protein [Nocardia terpenica]MBF6123534.1 hypothetical protein [Nocardia terpenica]MBF6156811.1 hypothetical protein [Nocardia terpenica]